MSDLYSILGVSKSADEKAVKSAYRKLAKELHPDKNKDNPKASERFNLVTRAYDILSDKKKRGQYDRGEIDSDGNPRAPAGFSGFGGGPHGAGANGSAFGGSGFDGGIDLGDMFEGLFGGGQAGRPQSGFGGGQRQPPAKGANIAYSHLVSFTDAATLTPQRIILNDGKTVEIKLPAGVVEGTQIRLTGKGHAGPGGNGDAMVSLKIGKHPFFERDGDNIRLDLPITLKEAVNGAKVKVPTVSGAVLLTLPAGTNGGTVMRLKGKGFTKKGANDARGDQLVTIMIHISADDEALKAFVDTMPDDANIRSDMGV